MDNRTANRIRNAWKVGMLSIRYDGEEWNISGQCISNNHPIEGWKVGQFYHLGRGRTLKDAAKAAMPQPLPTPPSEG